MDIERYGDGSDLLPCVQCGFRRRMGPNDEVCEACVDAMKVWRDSGGNRFSGALGFSPGHDLRGELLPSHDPRFDLGLVPDETFWWECFRCHALVYGLFMASMCPGCRQALAISNEELNSDERWQRRMADMYGIVWNPALPAVVTVDIENKPPVKPSAEDPAAAAELGDWWLKRGFKSYDIAREVKYDRFGNAEA